MKVSELRVAVVGGGGREHALAWKIAQSSYVSRVFCCPGNGGTECESGLTNVPISLEDVGRSVECLSSLAVDLVVIGPEQPLVAGLADALRAHRIAVVGPTAAAAQLEGSKSFAKALMVRAGVPTARSVTCDTVREAKAALESFATPPVIKADGLAAGKGVTVPTTHREALAAVTEALVGGRFGEAGRSVLVEERLKGVEVSYIVLTDGHRFRALPTSQDHKRLLDGDRGPNTGGMGAYTPSPHVTAEIERVIVDRVIEPTLVALRDAGLDFRGFLYAGLMLTADGPKVLEFNVRAGDPETQSLMFGLDVDLVPTLWQVAHGHLESSAPLPASPAANVVLATRDYPQRSEKGLTISGLASADSQTTKVFHAGTRIDHSDQIDPVDQMYDVKKGDQIERLGQPRCVTNGGRVLAVTARGETVKSALTAAYGALTGVTFDGAQHRTDIGAQAEGIENLD